MGVGVMRIVAARPAPASGNASKALRTGGHLLALCAMERPADEKQEYRFWAFISYSSRDAAVAKKLHRALETYSIPRDLRGRPGRDGPIPEKLFPIFRDRDELPLASDLGSTITDALKASRYLIVLCSPNAAKSRWVDEEVRTFKAMGREDRILALIVSGEPNGATIPGKEELECFPPSLKTRIGLDGKPTGEPVEPIGGDLRKGGDGWTVAFLKAVAGITGLGFNAFARREQKRKRVRQGIAAGLTLILLGAGIWTWDYRRVKITRFEHFTLCHGVPRGFGKVDDDEFNKRYLTFQIEESQRKVRRLCAVNRHGTPGTFSLTDTASFIDGAEFGYPGYTSSLVVKYREDGSVATHDLFDVTGRAILRHVYSADQKTVELRNPSRDSAQTMAANSGSVGSRGSGSALGAAETNAGKTEIARWRVKVDDRGYVIEKSYGNAWGDPTADRDGKAVVRYTRDDEGRVTGETALGLDGEPVEETGSTIVSSRSEYDNKGRLAFFRFLDIDGKPTVGPLGYAVEEVHHDAAGNVIERRFLGKDGELVTRLDGFGIFRANYDEHGTILSKKFYDTAGKPVVVPGFGFHELRIEHDKLGREISKSGFGINGEALTMAEGYHGIRFGFDAGGRISDQMLFGNGGEAVRHPKEFWHHLKVTFDARGNEVGVQLLGIDENPVANADGVSQIAWTFDEADRFTTWRCYGADGAACLDKDGIHETKFRYDGRGNITRWANFGTDRKPILCGAGYHVMAKAYDERGNQIEVSYLGVGGEPVVEKSSRLHRITYGYNSKGQHVETRVFNAANARAHDLTDGQHLTRYTYDALGNIASESFFDASDKPINRRSDGIHRFERESDIHGRILSETYFNHEGRKALNNEGWHKLVQQFDDHGNENSEAYLGISGEPVNRAGMGIQKISREFDEHGRQTSERYIDAAGHPAPMKGYRFVKWVQEFDTRGNVISKTYFDARDRPVELSDTSPYAMERMVYDERGNIVESTYFNTQLQPMVLEGGFHKTVDVYDGMGHRIQSDYFDTAGKPVNSTDGYFRFVAVYDARGQLVERRYFDVNGVPAFNLTLLAHWAKRIFDDRGNMLEEAYFDTSDKPVLGSGRIHKFVQKFDAANRELEERYFGVEGEPIVADDSGAHVTACKYDEFGQLVEMSWFGTHDEPVSQPNGFHRKVSEFEASGNESSTSYFGTNGQPVSETETGAHRVRRKFNSRNELVEVSFEDTAGKPMLSPNGYARLSAAYDERGNLSEVRYFGADGKPVLCNGSARWVRKYDPVTNEPLEKVIYDLEDNPVPQ